MIGELSTELPARAGKVEEQANRIGLVLSPLTPAQQRMLGIERGLLVRTATGPAAKVGLRAGDVIIALNDVPVETVEAFNQLVERSVGRMIALLVQRGSSVLYVPITVK